MFIENAVGSEVRRDRWRTGRGQDEDDSQHKGSHKREGYNALSGRGDNSSSKQIHVLAELPLWDHRLIDSWPDLPELRCPYTVRAY